MVNLGKLRQQTMCNESEVKLFEEPINDDFANAYAWATTFNCCAKKRTFTVGPSWIDMSDFDRGCTFLHEMTHACLKTTDHSYRHNECKSFPWIKASENAQNYAFFLHGPFLPVFLAPH